MKRILISFVLFFAISLHGQSNNFIVTTDTLKVEIKKNGGKSIFFNGNFHQISYGDKMMYIFDTNGVILQTISLPQEIHRYTSYNLHVENGTLFISDERKESTYCFDEKALVFYQTKFRHFKLYQDSLFNVYSVCKGEWGGTIYFEEIKNGSGLIVDAISLYPFTKYQFAQNYRVYEANVQCPIVVNKIEDIYYLTAYYRHAKGYNHVYKIVNPYMMEESELDFKNIYRKNYFSGIETLFSYSSYEMPLDIHTSFVLNDELLHLYSDKDGTFVGIIDNKKMTPIYSFGFNFFSEFIYQIDASQQVLKFRTPDWKYGGIFLLKENQFQFYFIELED